MTPYVFIAFFLTSNARLSPILNSIQSLGRLSIMSYPCGNDPHHALVLLNSPLENVLTAIPETFHIERMQTQEQVSTMLRKLSQRGQYGTLRECPDGLDLPRPAQTLCFLFHTPRDMSYILHVFATNVHHVDHMFWVIACSWDCPLVVDTMDLHGATQISCARAERLGFNTHK